MTRPTAVVVGLGVSGVAASRRLLELGYDVVATDDAAGGTAQVAADDLALRLVLSPTPEELRALVDGADIVVPSPGVPAHHAVFAFAAAAGVPIESEIGLAIDAIEAPIVAITGTNGKTTVTTLVADMLERSGMRTAAAGNVGLPLTALIGRPLDVVVVEVSSFQLQLTPRFRAHVGVWLNLAADHLDWHGDSERYAEAKSRIWANQGPDDVAIANADDDIVARWAEQVSARLVTFGRERRADYSVVGGALVGPSDDVLVRADELWRSLPHDLANALGAAAAASAAGASAVAVADALRAFRGLPHRLALVGDASGVRWYDDSKATNPHAAVAAIRSFDSVVLVAGGLNKGLDLSAMAEAADRVRAVVAIGAAAPEVIAAFGDRVPAVRAGSMDDAVRVAADFARAGDAVLLSPGCASFDQYDNYGARGDDFARAVAELIGADG